VLLAVVRELRRDEAAGRRITDLRSTEVLLWTDGSVQIHRDERQQVTARQQVAAGACVGRLMVELLVGRPALGRDDALEPHITSSLPMQTTTLLARSCDDVSGQWPDLDQWATELEALAGAAAAPLAPAELAARRRRRIGLAVGTAILIAVSMAVLLLAPRWWDAATSEEGSPIVRAAPARADTPAEPAHGGVSAGTDRNSAAAHHGAAR